MHSKTFLGAVVFVVAACVIAGLLMTGGPIFQRNKRLDEGRYQDLSKIADALLCSKEDSKEQLPAQKLSMQELQKHCARVPLSDAELKDRETGEPYVLVWDSSDQVALCAKFQDAGRFKTYSNGQLRAYRREYLSNFDTQRGCIVLKRI